MTSLLRLLKWLLVCGAVSVVALLVLLSIPKSDTRNFLKPIVGWTMADYCAVYAISSIDIIPDAELGPFEQGGDIGAVIIWIAAARMAMKGTRE